MTNRIRLLAGAGLTTVALFAATAADAAPAKKYAAPARDSEIQELKEQVRALTQRIDMQEQMRAESSAQINTAQAQAATAVVQAQSAQASADAAAKAVPAEVKTALAAAPKPKKGWYDDTSISGRMYFNVSNINQKVNGVKPSGNSSLNGTGFNIKRFYLGVDHKFDDVFAANVTMDVSNVVGNTANANFPGSPANGASTVTVPATCVTGTVACTVTVPAQPINNNVSLVGKGFYIKKAYLQAKLDPALIIRVGAADLPWVPYDEGFYGYRHIENTLIDRTNFGTSADWGVHVLGDLAGGLFSYQVSAIDGGGYRNVKVTKTIDLEGRASVNYKGVFAGVGGYTGKRGNDTQNAILANGQDLHTATREDALVGYKTKLFTVGAEYFHTKNWNTVTSVAEDKSDGYSVFGNVNFAKTWSVFGRYDRVKPTKDLNDNLKDNYFNVGIQWEPVKIVDLALVYKRDKVDNGLFGTQNGTIGGANPAATPLIGGRGTYDEFGLFGQLRF